MEWVDNHCHLDPGDVTETLAAAREAGVTRLITVGTDLAHSEQAIQLARDHRGVWATAGVHPHDAAGGLEGIEALLDDECVVAVGECGLDYYYDHSPREVQRRVFAEQVGMAHTHSLPLVIHTRDAWGETFDILESEGIPPSTVFHCFTGGPDEAELALAMGAHLSFSGIVSFKNADDLRAAARLCPLERLLVETDAPYLAPEPHRGRRNEPAFVVAVGAAVAAAKEVGSDVISSSSTANAIAFYDL